MACHGITNVTARLEIDLGALVDNPALALAAAQGLAELLRLTEPTRTTQGFNYVILWAGRVAATVYRTGELSCSDFRIDNTPASVAEINAAATQIVTALAGLASQARLADLIGRLCPVETVERAANGAVVMTVSL